MNDVMPCPSTEQALPGNPLMLKAQLLIQLDRFVIEGKDPERHTMQVHFEKRIIEQQPQRLLPVSLSPVRSISNIDNAFGIAVFQIDIN